MYENIADLLDHLDAFVPCRCDGLRLLRPRRESDDAAIRFIRNLEKASHEHRLRLNAAFESIEPQLLNGAFKKCSDQKISLDVLNRLRSTR